MQHTTGGMATILPETNLEPHVRRMVFIHPLGGSMLISLDQNLHTLPISAEKARGGYGLVVDEHSSCKPEILHPKTGALSRPHPEPKLPKPFPPRCLPCSC